MKLSVVGMKLVRWPEQSMLIAQSNLAITYSQLGWSDEALLKFPKILKILLDQCIKVDISIFKKFIV